MEKKRPQQMNKMLSYNIAKEKLSISEKAGQLFMPAAFINDSEDEIKRLEDLIHDNYIGGLCFFHSRASAATNFEGKKAVVYNKESFDALKKLIHRYQKVAKYPLLIAIDAEWGLAMRVENTPQYPYAITLGALQNSDDLIYEVGRNIARDCKAAGIHWNLAPVVDINNNPDNPVIGYRSFGEDKLKVTGKALSFIKGTQSEGILTSIKHFPGHGDTATDSHLELPLIDKSKEELLENELYPFQKLIDQGIDSVMVGHLAVPALSGDKNLSSSISKQIIKGILREEMGFRGIVISDALNMYAVSRHYPVKGELEWLAFDAGNDILCFAEHPKEGIATIVENATENQIEESFKRIWELKEQVLKDQAQGSNKKLVVSDGLNRRLAHKSLTLWKGTVSDISTFKKTGYIGLEFSKNSGNYFFKNINNNIPFESVVLKKSTIDEIHDIIKNHENFLLALFPSKVKPQNNFDISSHELALINELIATKNVVLYLFGNPYVLKLIDTTKAKATVIAYQDFKVFQEVAAEHFLERIEAKGKLPISINTNTE